MLKKKVCLLGAFAAGKTSLVARFVKSIFSDKYHTTVGVKIDSKSVLAGDQEILILLWDLYGEGEEDEFQKVRMTYLNGASGYILVVDGTRPETLQTAQTLHQRVLSQVGQLPFVVALNKVDLSDEWELTSEDLESNQTHGWEFIYTSAKSGEGVEVLFQHLAQKMVSK